MSSKKTVNPFITLRSVVIVLLLLSVALMASCSGGDFNGPNYSFSTGGFPINDPDFTVSKTIIDDIPADGRIRVIIEAISGEVVVTGREDVDTVLVTAHLFVTSDRLQEAERQLENLDMRVTERTEEILIQTDQPQIINGCTYRVEYDIIVPDRLEVVTEQTNGAIAVLDIQNRVEVSNENGDVSLLGIVGGVVASVKSGGIECTVVLPLNESIDLSATNGGIVLSTPTSTSAEFLAAVNGIGRIIVSNLNINDSLGTANSLTGTLGDGEGSIVLRTVNGNIEVFGID